jgi:hypothetical protein
MDPANSPVSRDARGNPESAWKERDLCHQYFVRKIIVPLAGQSDIFFSPKKSPKILLEFFSNEGEVSMVT